MALGMPSSVWASWPATQRASRLAKVPPLLRWPRCWGQWNISASAATASISMAELARPPSRAWLLGLTDMASA